ncbi:hypothetical protein [Kingella oralis]|uniref:hypothetical protein n=1 Tax=Kingella oralis TaxID=505 RepID=UPI0012DF22F2|nr:hypothetical protein [Kingella oralis]QMT43746.1 hypothetical protein H3L93_05335 [Kingella oralis]
MPASRRSAGKHFKLPNFRARVSIFRLPYRVNKGSLKSLQNLHPIERRRLADILSNKKHVATSRRRFILDFRLPHRTSQRQPETTLPRFQAA